MMTNSQSSAIRIEHIMSNVFECERFGVGGLVNSDYIRRHPFMAMMSTLTFLCGSSRNDTTVAAKFFESYHYYGEWSIDELLSFESNCKVINGSTYEIEYANGEEAMESIIAAFSEACSKLK